MKKGLIVVLVIIVVLILGLGIVLKGRKKEQPPNPFHIQIPQNAFGPSVTRGVCVLMTGGFGGGAVNGFVIWEKEGQVLIDKEVWNYIAQPERVLSLNLTEGEPFETAMLTKLIDRSKALEGIEKTTRFLLPPIGTDANFFYYIIIKDDDSERVYEINEHALDETRRRRLNLFFELVEEIRRK